MLLHTGVVAIWCAMCASAQFIDHDTDGTLREAVMDAAGTAIFASASDTNEVVKIDASSGEILARTSVGSNPGPIASDGTHLAVVGNSGKTVSFVQLSDFRQSAASTIDSRANAITALPGGGFAVVNSFADSVTLLDPGRADSPMTINGVSSVPSGIAASTSYLAVSTRSPAALLLFEGGAQSPVATVPVPDGPSRVVALSGDRFAVLTKSSVVVIDSSTSRIAAKVDIVARDIAARGAALFVLGGGAVDVYDESLKAVASIPTTAEARSIAVSSNGFALLAAKSKSWQFCNSLPDGASGAAIEAPVAVARLQPDPPPATAPAAVEAVSAPAVEQARTQPEVADASPAPIPVGTEAAATAPAAPASSVEPPTETSAAKMEETATAGPEFAAAAPAEPEPVVVAQDIAEAADTPQPEEAATPAATPESTPTAEQGTTTIDEKGDARAETKQKTGKPKSSPWPARRSRIRPGGEVPQPDTTAPVKSRSGRPEVSPIDSGAARETTIGQTVTEGITAPTQDGGFTPPTNVNEFLNVQYGEMTQKADGSMTADGDVRFTLVGAPDVQFAADHLEYDSTTGHLFASGNVEIVQGPSTAFADEIATTIYPGTSAGRIQPPLVGARDTDDDLAQKLMSIGDLEAKNIDIIEPARRLRAEKLVYDFSTGSGYMVNMEGQVGQIRFGGDELRMAGDDKGGGTNLWLTTCDCDHEYYRVRVKELDIDKDGSMLGKGAQLEIGRTKTPIYWPRWAYSGGPTPTAGVDFTSGKKAELGYYINVGQQFAISPDFQLGYRLFPTTKEGVGFGFDGTYNYMETPASPLFRGAGEFHTLYTTEDRGYYEWYHRHELTPNTVLLLNLEQWGDKNFYKDFYYDKYKDRTVPRNFVNVTYTQPGYIATATASKDTHDFTNEAEKLPEVTFHLLERELLPRVYLTFDTVDGYRERASTDDNAFRSVNVARLSTDIEIGALNVTPFLELEASYYSKVRDKGNDDDSDARFSSLAGTTVQTRFQKAYGGAFGFSGFKHIVVPSVTYSYRSEPTMGVEETPRFDAYDNVYGRSRIETKLDNILMGRDAETGDTWQVARLSLYQGNDLWNEIRRSTDYEIELDLRPRSWWGFEIIGEHHSIEKEEDLKLDEPYLLQRTLIELYEAILDEPFDAETADKYNTRYGDYDRILTYLYYDNREFGGNLNGRIGYAYTKTQDDVFNREILYGLGYKINEKWSVAFEHRYDLERGELYRQKYEVRRVMNCLEGALLVNERGSGWDLGVELSVTGIPGTKIRF